MPNAYLHFGFGDEPRQTIVVPVKVTDAPRYHTQSGYGLKLPSRYMVKWAGRWRRVYICQISNAGSAYIGKPGAWLATVDVEG